MNSHVFDKIAEILTESHTKAGTIPYYRFEDPALRFDTVLYMGQSRGYVYAGRYAADVDSYYIDSRIINVGTAIKESWEQLNESERTAVMARMLGAKDYCEWCDGELDADFGCPSCTKADL